MALTVLITSAQGEQFRLGADEPDSGWVPFGISWESTVPGGWKGCSFSLRRRIDEDVPLRLFDEVEVIDEHGVTLYEGRIVKLPRQHGDDFLLNVECLGWASHLLDDPSVPYFYVDRDLSPWREGGAARRVAISTSAIGSLAVVPGADPALMLSYQGGWPAGGMIAEAFYEAPPGMNAYSVSLTWRTNPNIGLGGGAWVFQQYSTDDEVTFADAGTDRLTGVATTGSFTYTPATARKMILLQLFYSTGPITSDGTSYELHLTDVMVRGDHNIATVGTFPDQGFYIDDMLAHALAAGAPKLNFTTGDGGSIERPPLVIQQASDGSLGTVERILLDLNKYVIWDWLVYENKTFFYRPTDPDRLTWEARLDQGIHLSLEGDDAEHAYNGAMVRYTVPGDTAKVAGPTGSGLDVESDLLLDEDTENTVSQHGYPRRWIELDISFPTLDDYAVVIGAAYLAQASLPARSGDITLKGMVEHPTKGLRPAREIRAGDWIRLSDHPADVPRRIISCRHTDDSGETVVSVGNDLNKVDAMLEQVQVKTRGVV